MERLAAIDLLSREERNLYNPAFAALIATRVVQGFNREYDGGCHIVLTTLAGVMAFLRPVRDALPTRITTTAVNWIEREDDPRIYLAQAAPFLGPIVRDGVVVALQNRTLVLDGARLHLTDRASTRITASTDEVVGIQRAAIFLGRWLPRVGDEKTILTLLGVRP
nr:DUF6521 family protein [Dactylosporangium thailandense]